MRSRFGLRFAATAAAVVVVVGVAFSRGFAAGADAVLRVTVRAGLGVAAGGSITGAFPSGEMLA
jgi:hypothetical protein